MPEDKRIKVSQVLDERARIFSMPAAIILPALLIISFTGMLTYLLGFPSLMIIFTIVCFTGIYFFLFGQEWWRLFVKFYRTPIWVRSDVLAVPFTLKPRAYLPRHEAINQAAKTKRTRIKEGRRPHRK